jgi:hypothetical protein
VVGIRGDCNRPIGANTDYSCEALVGKRARSRGKTRERRSKPFSNASQAVLVKQTCLTAEIQQRHGSNSVHAERQEYAARSRGGSMSNAGTTAAVRAGLLSARSTSNTGNPGSLGPLFANGGPDRT